MHKYPTFNLPERSNVPAKERGNVPEERSNVPEERVNVPEERVYVPGRTCERTEVRANVPVLRSINSGPEGRDFNL